MQCIIGDTKKGPNLQNCHIKRRNQFLLLLWWFLVRATQINKPELRSKETCPASTAKKLAGPPQQKHKRARPPQQKTRRGPSAVTRSAGVSLATTQVTDIPVQCDPDWIGTQELAKSCCAAAGTLTCTMAGLVATGF